MQAVLHRLCAAYADSNMARDATAGASQLLGRSGCSLSLPCVLSLSFVEACVRGVAQLVSC
eukprot:2325171-Rhodomonas_salina.1